MELLIIREEIVCIIVLSCFLAYYVIYGDREKKSHVFYPWACVQWGILFLMLLLW